MFQSEKRSNSWGKKSAGNCCIIRSFINLFIPGKLFTVLHLLAMDFSTICNRIRSGFRQKFCNRNLKSCLWGSFLEGIKWDFFWIHTSLISKNSLRKTFSLIYWCLSNSHISASVPSSLFIECARLKRQSLRHLL